MTDTKQALVPVQKGASSVAVVTRQHSDKEIAWARKVDRVDDIGTALNIAGSVGGCAVTVFGIIGIVLGAGVPALLLAVGAAAFTGLNVTSVGRRDRRAEAILADVKLIEDARKETDRQERARRRAEQEARAEALRQAQSARIARIESAAKTGLARIVEGRAIDRDCIGMEWPFEVAGETIFRDSVAPAEPKRFMLRIEEVIDRHAALTSTAPERRFITARVYDAPADGGRASAPTQELDLITHEQDLKADAGLRQGFGLMRSGRLLRLPARNAAASPLASAAPVAPPPEPPPGPPARPDTPPEGAPRHHGSGYGTVV